MTCYTIGYRREDGDIQVLATINNNDGVFLDESFRREPDATLVAHTMAEKVRDLLQERVASTLEIFERQDAPDYITLESDT